MQDWLGGCAAHTPGTAAANNNTIRLDTGNVL